MKKTLFLLVALTSGMMLSMGCGGPEVATPEESEASMDEAMGMDTMGGTVGEEGGDNGGGDNGGGDEGGGDEGAATTE